MLKFGPFSGHFDYLARIRVLARNFGSTGSSDRENFMLYILMQTFLFKPLKRSCNKLESTWE